MSRDEEFNDDVFEADDETQELEGGVWQPPPNVTLHNGTKIPVDADYFVAPPADIGEIVTAQTTLKNTKEPFAVGPRFLLVFGLSGAVGFGAFTLVRLLMMNPNDARDLGLFLGGMGAIVTAIVVILLTRFRHTCSYVGKLGVARYILTGSRDNVPAEEKLLFADCEDVTTWTQRNYTNGIYSGTQYLNTWRSVDGRGLLLLKGSFHSEAGTPKATSPFWFANSAEVYWNEFAFDRMVTQFEKEGHVDFRVNKKDLVRVGPGFLEFNFHGKSTRLSQEDIKSLSIANGTFSIHTHEARWFSSKGKFGFEYGGMGNAKLFLFALERLAGYTFSD